jgi:uncharacterized protein (DUF362 family)
MADASYQTKVYTKQGGDEIVVASGGLIAVEPGGYIDNGSAVQLTATAAIAAGVQNIALNHATVVIAATMVATEHRGLVIIGDTSASGTAAHTVTLTSGTFNGTATIATFNAPGETLIVFFDEAGVGTIVANIGAVALS